MFFNMATTATIITLFEDAAKTKALAPRTKVEGISNASGVGLDALLDKKLNIDASGNVVIPGSITLGDKAVISYDTTKNAIKISFK